MTQLQPLIGAVASRLVSHFFFGFALPGRDMQRRIYDPSSAYRLSCTARSADIEQIMHPKVALVCTSSCQFQHRRLHMQTLELNRQG